MKPVMGPEEFKAWLAGMHQAGRLNGEESTAVLLGEAWDAGANAMVTLFDTILEVTGMQMCTKHGLTPPGKRGGCGSCEEEESHPRGDEEGDDP